MSPFFLKKIAFLKVLKTSILTGMRYLFPWEVCTDLRGFSALTELYALGKSEKLGGEIILDFSRCHWFEANMCAPLYSVIARFFLEMKSVSVGGIRDDIIAVFQKNGFAEIIRLQRVPDANGTTIPFVRFRPTETRGFAEYSTGKFKEFFVRKRYGNPPENFFESVNEIFQNSAFHSKTNASIAACGQFFPASRRIDFAISDSGIGIPRSVREFIRSPIDDSDAVVWAMSDSNTTRVLNPNGSPGGLGLKIVRDFIDTTYGKLVIVSGTAFVCREIGKTETVALENPFPGTCVNIEVNIVATTLLT